MSMELEKIDGVWIDHKDHCRKYTPDELRIELTRQIAVAKSRLQAMEAIEKAEVK